MLYTVVSTPRLLLLSLISLSPDFSGVRSYLLRTRNSLTSLLLESAHTRLPLLWANAAHFLSLICCVCTLLLATLCPLNLLALCSGRESSWGPQILRGDIKPLNLQSTVSLPTRGLGANLIPRVIIEETLKIIQAPRKFQQSPSLKN